MSRIMDRDAKINAYYVSPKGDRHRVAENIPYYLLDRLVPLLTKKYAITMNDIEVRPADKNQYRRTSQPELAEGQTAGPNEVADLLYKTKPEIFSRFGDDFVMDAITNVTQDNVGSAQELAIKVAAELKRGMDEGISRRGILKGLGAAMAAGAADKASAIAGAFPSPSTREKWAKDAAASNAAEAKRLAAIKAKQDAERLQKNTELVDKEQRVNHHKLDEFAPGNGDDGLPYAEYQVYQCNPEDQFEWIGGPLYQTDNMGMAHKYAYEKYVKHRPKAFMIWQERSQGSRGNYGVKGQSDHDEGDLNEDYLDEK